MHIRCLHFVFSCFLFLRDRSPGSLAGPEPTPPSSLSLGSAILNFRVRSLRRQNAVTLGVPASGGQKSCWLTHTHLLGPGVGSGVGDVPPPLTMKILTRLLQGKGGDSNFGDIENSSGTRFKPTWSFWSTSVRRLSTYYSLPVTFFANLRGFGCIFAFSAFIHHMSNGRKF